MQQNDQLEAPDAPAADPFLERLFELSLDLLCVFDAGGTLRKVNPAFTDTLGWTAGELTSHSLFDFVHPADRARAREVIAHRAAREATVACDCRWRCANGDYRWLSWKSSAADDNGLIYGVGRDVTRSKQAESELRALHDFAVVGISVTDPRGRFLKANAAFCEMIGYSEEELLQKTSTDITLPDDRPEQAEYLRRMITGEKRSHIVEKPYLRKDGGVIWGRVTISAIRDAMGGLEAFLAVVEDITEARRTESALHESEARYSRIASNVPGMVYQSRREADGATSFPYISDGAFDIYGVSAAEIQANPRYVFDVVHPDDRARFDASMTTALSRRAPWRWTGRIIVNGDVKWLEGAARPQHMPDGATVWDGLLLDVTEARQAARRLEESENRYRSLFEYHPDAVFSLDTHGRFQTANPVCELICGYSPREMMGQSFELLVTPDQLDKALAQFSSALEGIAASCELSINHKSGRRVEINVTNVPVIVAGEVVGVFGIARDLTRERALDEQLRQAQKMEAVGQLAAGVAHDFNNVLTVIQGCSEFLIGSLPDGDERRADVDMIRDAAASASTLTRQLLAFSRKQVLQFSIVDLNACIADLQRMLARMMGEDINLVADLADDLHFVSADVSQLEQVIVNMTVNARDAMPNGGELRFTTRNCVIDEDHVSKHPGATEGPHVRLSISDNGCGMDEATLSRIFEPFFTTKSVGKGTGLGLATAYGIIRQSSGHIAVTSAPGAGTTFDVYLPVMDAAPSTAAVANATVPAPAADGAHTILLVEDDANVRSLASQILRRDGHIVIEAANGAEALQITRDRDGYVDLIVTDAIMPVMNGGELADAVAREFPRIKVLFMSLFTGDSIVQRGADERRAFLPKPFANADLSRKVREVLAGARRPSMKS